MFKQQHDDRNDIPHLILSCSGFRVEWACTRQRLRHNLNVDSNRGSKMLLEYIPRKNESIARGTARLVVRYTPLRCDTSRRRFSSGNCQNISPSSVVAVGPQRKVRVWLAFPPPPVFHKHQTCAQPVLHKHQTCAQTEVAADDRRQQGHTWFSISRCIHVWRGVQCSTYTLLCPIRPVIIIRVSVSIHHANEQLCFCASPSSELKKGVTVSARMAIFTLPQQFGVCI